MAGIRERKYKGKKKPYYEISWYVDGKQYKKGGFTSKVDAQIALSQYIDAKNSTNIKFDVLARYYIDRHCTLHCKASTRILYEGYLKCNMDTLKLKNAKEIKALDIENLIISLKNKGLTNKTINNTLIFVKAVLNYGVENEFLRNNPVAKIKKLPQIKHIFTVLDETQIELFLNLARNLKYPYYPFFATAIYTGMRRGELLALEWSDIDFKNNKISVNKQLYKGIKQPTKTNKERVIDIPSTLIEILKEHKKSNNYLTKLVFHYEGKPLHPYNMENRYFHPLIKECNKHLDAETQIEKFRFHDIRHTYATYMLSKGAGIKWLQNQLGHASANMTLDTYAKYLPSDKQKAMNILENISIKNDEKEHIKNIEK